MPTCRFSDRDYALLFGDDSVAPGDAVVHFEHGLARYDGESDVDLGDHTQTLTHFIYRDGGKLMVPAVAGQDYWPYGAPAEDASLDRLEAGDWERRRDEMILELRESATALAAEDAERRALAASRIVPDTDVMAEVAETFGHTPTEDQARAIDAVLADMDNTVPMNRLLIGDVGFGKTEVALRAAAAVASSGHQVVLAAPTTVLARQHADTFRARAGDLGFGVAEISRMITGDALSQALADIASGAVQIIVGTQSLLSDDLAFKSLALVILDEEQKFGRQQKLDLRGLHPGAHILSMTATPIPRSLAAAEVGLIDISVVATPPQGRKTIDTTLAATDINRVHSTIAAELARGGQCYVVCPRISDLDEVEALLRDDDPDLRYGVAHGQMPDSEMETQMLRFMQGDVDLLLSTSIIESGLDNGRANTMIVWHGDQFGLSQLHQLRGRIGRGDTPAVMLILTDIDLEDDALDAVSRLNAFATMTDIGSGFDIARRDRDIRGFGELDGTEQSGQMSRLGIGLYRHVLKAHLDGGDGAT